MAAIAVFDGKMTADPSNAGDALEGLADETGETLIDYLGWRYPSTRETKT